VLVARVTTLGVRNLTAAEVAIPDGVTLLWGPNGAGKTSFLEAVCLALAGRSPRTRRAREIIAFGQPLARAEAEVADAPEHRAFLWSVTRSGEHRHLMDGSEVRPEDSRARPSLAIFQPDRLALIKGPPGGRRDHLDRFCAAVWPARAEARRRYARALAQRNALVGRIRAGLAQPDSLDAWDHELAEAGAELVAARAEAARLLAPGFATAAGELGAPAPATLAYRPRSTADSAEGLAAELAERRQSDLGRGFTGHGPHLDEVSLAVGDRELRRYGSQGEQRLGLLALLFAERGALMEAGRPLPLMLLDDVMSELDQDRRHLLAARLVEGGGQAILTATEAAHLPASCARLELAVRGGAVLEALDGETRAAA
jgi:DNA replication and repair protein RecF